ncbi:MAG: hypothetical protein LBE08_06140 [Bifidobacteriaceae bacterium]|nr:hypothetical protein [Bifidobacteriaceae bacterium]
MDGEENTALGSADAGSRRPANDLRPPLPVIALPDLPNATLDALTAWRSAYSDAVIARQKSVADSLAASISGLTVFPTVDPIPEEFFKQQKEAMARLARSISLPGVTAIAERLSDQILAAQRAPIAQLACPVDLSGFAPAIRLWDESHADVMATIGDRIGSFRADLARVLARWGKVAAGDWVDKLRVRGYPANLRAARRSTDLEWLSQVLLVEGTALFGVPGPKLIDSLASISSGANRRRWLSRRLGDLADDCEAMTAPHLEGDQRAVASFLCAAIGAIRGGHHAAAQALLANITESLVNGLESALETVVRSHNEGETQQDLADRIDKEHCVADWLALQPVLAAYVRYLPKKGDKMPLRFSRHASAHRMSARQFNRPNTAQALLCATSLATYLYGWPSLEAP